MEEQPNILDKQQIREADDLERELVEVPEWGGAIYIRGLTGEERDEWESEFLQASNKMVEVEAEVDGKTRKQKMNTANARARLVARTAVDEDWERIFDVSDVQWLGQKSAQALDRCYDKARQLSGISEEDVEEAEEAIKNGLSGSSGSNSA